MTLEEKIAEIRSSSMEAARAEGNDIIESYRRALEKVFEDNKQEAVRQMETSVKGAAEKSGNGKGTARPETAGRTGAERTERQGVPGSYGNGGKLYEDGGVPGLSALLYPEIIGVCGRRGADDLYESVGCRTQRGIGITVRRYADYQ